MHLHRPYIETCRLRYGACSSMVERLTVHQEVMGSSPITYPWTCVRRFMRPAWGDPRPADRTQIPR
jgi:hypothetical protein